MKNKRITICILALIILIAALFLIANWIPEKYAIRDSEFSDYEPFILVKEVHYTGTGWLQVGNENGYFPKETCVDIDLTNGNILPQMKLYDEDYANTFLCKVEYRGKVSHDAFEEQIDSYSIVEWYPVYPILRDTILPNWLYPKAFMTKREVKSEYKDLYKYTENLLDIEWNDCIESAEGSVEDKYNISEEERAFIKLKVQSGCEEIVSDILQERFKQNMMELPGFSVLNYQGNDFETELKNSDIQAVYSKFMEGKAAKTREITIYVVYNEDNLMYIYVMG